MRLIARILLALAGFAFLVASRDTALAQPASKCTSREVKATGQKAACKATIFAKAASAGGGPDTAKLATCETKFSAAFAKAAAGTDCNSNVSEGTIETKVDSFVNDLNSEIAVSPPSRCQGAKLKAAGKKASCLLGVDAKGVMKSIAPDSVKHAACGAKMSGAFAKADGGTTCGTTSGDFSTIEGKVDAFEDDVLSEENPTTTTTTSSTTSSTTTSSTAVTTSSTTTTTTMPACGSAAYPTCGGACAAGMACVPQNATTFFSCACESPSNPCTSGFACGLGGWCPPGMACLQNMGICGGCGAP